MIKWLFAFLILYLLYKLIFDFIVPVSKASSQLRDKLNEMQQQQQPHQRTTDQSQPGNNTMHSTSGDYIEFEEVK